MPDRNQRHVDQRRVGRTKRRFHDPSCDDHDRSRRHRASSHRRKAAPEDPVQARHDHRVPSKRTGLSLAKPATASSCRRTSSTSETRSRHPAGPQTPRAYARDSRPLFRRRWLRQRWYRRRWSFGRCSMVRLERKSMVDGRRSMIGLIARWIS